MTRAALAALLVLPALLAGCKDKSSEPAPPLRRPLPTPGLGGGVTSDRAEVEQVFAEVGMKEEATFAELGNYAATAALESETWPAPSDPDPPAVPAAWRSLGVAPPVHPRCRYTVLAGTDQEAVPGLMGEELLGRSIPERHWWYALARCGDWVYGRANLSPGMRILRAGR